MAIMHWCCSNAHPSDWHPPCLAPFAPPFFPLPFTLFFSACQVEALDSLLSSSSDLFLPSDPTSQTAALIAGQRMYAGRGEAPSLRVVRGKVGDTLAGGEEGEREWEEVEERVRGWVEEGKDVQGGSRFISRSIFRHPRDEACMCDGCDGERK